jgi:hypothetical protein
MSEENKAPEMEAPASSGGNEDMIPRAETENLVKALKAERETRKQFERELKEQRELLKRFEGVNPDEWTAAQAELAEAKQREARYSEARDAIEAKYSQQASEAAKEAAAAREALAEYQKRYALEKVFYAAGGRTDAADGVSFFDMLANQIGASFRQEADGSLTVVDSAGDPVLDKESGKRISPDDFISSYKVHPIYGTFFKGAKGAGAGIGMGGTDANGIPVEDLRSLNTTELFKRAFS